MRSKQLVPACLLLMVLVPGGDLCAQSRNDGSAWQTFGAGNPGDAKGGGNKFSGVGGPSPELITYGYPPVGERLSPGDAVFSAAAGESGGGTTNRQDGDICDELENVVLGPQTTFPAGMPPAANYSLIGAVPHDLGALIRGGTWVPTPGFDDGAALQAQAILSSPLAHPPGYGAAFAVGSHGTVSPTTGAFVHPFTLLALPSYAQRMGLLVQLEYLSNANHPTADPQPFGPGFVLSGHDFLVETAGSSATEGASAVSLFRGDGHEARYTRFSGSNPWTYTGPLGAQDSLTAYYDAGTQALTYTRTFRDGRAVTYTRVAAYGQPGGDRYVRSKVVDGYGNQIQYGWATANGFAYLQTITETRGMVVQCLWDEGTPPRLATMFVDLSGAQIDPAEPGGGAITQSELQLDFAYDGSRRLQKIQWFPTNVTYDANADGRVATGESAVLRPTVELEYEENSKLAKVWDKTVASAPVLQLHVDYDQSLDWGVRVVAQAEGGVLGTPGVITHTYEYPTATTRRYTDPRGRIAELTLGTSDYKVIEVKMKPGPLTPRNDDQHTGVYADYGDLTWSILYGCCGLPTSITEPSGRVFQFVWQSQNGWQGNALQQLRVDQYSLHDFVLDDHGRVLEWKPGADPTPAVKVTYTDITGKVAPTQIELESRDYHDPRTGGSLGKSVATLTFDAATGRLTGTAHPGGGTSTFGYLAADAKGRMFLQTITGPAAGANLQITYACDDLGRPTSVTRGLPGGERVTTLFVDSHHRIRNTAAKAVATGPDIRSEIYHDRFGSVSIARRENLDSDGNARTRPWLQSEVIRDLHGRTVRTVRDGALVDAPAEVALATVTTWHDDHRVNTVTRPNGGVTTHVWDGYGLLYKTLVQASTSTTLTPVRYFYNKDAQVRWVWNGLDQELQIDRSSATGLVTAVHDPADLNRLDLAYDTSLRLERIAVWSSVQGAEVRATVLTYDELDRVEMVSVGPPGNPNSRRIHIYDLAGRLKEVGLQEHSGDTGSTGYLRGFKREFDVYGRLLWQRDRLSDTTDLWNKVSFVYDALSGLPTKLIETEIEQVGQFGPISGTGHITHEYQTWLTHDLLDRVTEVEQKPEGLTGDSVVHKYHYDSLHDLVRFQDTLLAELRWGFDGLGNLRKRTEKGTSGGEIVTTTDIDFITGVITRTDDEDRFSKFRHDKAWRLEKQELPGYTTGPAFSHVFGYDAASRMTSITNGNGVQILRTYDASGRLTEQRAVAPQAPHSLAATKEVLTYNEFGGFHELTTWSGANYDVIAVKVTQAEDSYGRFNWETLDFGFAATLGVTSGYAVAGGLEDLMVRRSLAVSGVATVSLQLDRLGRTWGYGNGNGTAEEFIARYRFVGGRARERQQGAQTGGGWLLESDYGWDPLRRLASIETKSGSTTLSRFDHGFDLEGHLLKRKRDRVGVASGGGDLFQLDEYYRLAGVKLGVDPSQYGGTFQGATNYQKFVEYSPASAPLDKAQNRHLVRETVGGNTTDTTYAVNANSHRYDTVGGLMLAYDGEGSLVFDGLRFYVYDFKNRLSEVWMYVPADGEQSLQVSGTMARDGRPRYAVPKERLERIRARARNTLLSAERMRQGYADVTGRAALANQDLTLAATEGNLQIIAAYFYDPYNRRVARFVAGQPALYSSWDGWREVGEHTWNGSSWQAQRAYVWGGRIDELIRFSRNVGGTWEHFHPQQDHQDTVDLLVGADGTLKEKYEYDPFGGVTVFTWNGSAWVSPVGGSSLGNPYTYTGRRLDGETGLMYYRHRYYSASLGRFLTGDPLGVWADVHSVGNPYCGFGNSPSFLGDPLGLQVVRFSWTSRPPLPGQTPRYYAMRHDDPLRVYDITRVVESAEVIDLPGKVPGYLRNSDKDGNKKPDLYIPDEDWATIPHDMISVADFALQWLGSFLAGIIRSDPAHEIWETFLAMQDYILQNIWNPGKLVLGTGRCLRDLWGGLVDGLTIGSAGKKWSEAVKKAAATAIAETFEAFLTGPGPKGN